LGVLSERLPEGELADRGIAWADAQTAAPAAYARHDVVVVGLCGGSALGRDGHWSMRDRVGRGAILAMEHGTLGCSAAKGRWPRRQCGRIARAATSFRPSVS
jgi:hypothetical protein